MILVNTRRYLDVDSTSFGRYGRQMDVRTTLCVLTEMLEVKKKSRDCYLRNNIYRNLEFDFPYPK